MFPCNMVRRTVVAPEAISPSSQMSSAQQQLLSAALFSASERAPDPLGDLLWQLGDRVKASEFGWISISISEIHSPLHTSI